MIITGDENTTSHKSLRLAFNPLLNKYFDGKLQKPLDLSDRKGYMAPKNRYWSDTAFKVIAQAINGGNYMFGMMNNIFVGLVHIAEHPFTKNHVITPKAEIACVASQNENGGYPIHLHLITRPMTAREFLRLMRTSWTIGKNYEVIDSANLKPLPKLGAKPYCTPIRGSIYKVLDGGWYDSGYLFQKVQFKDYTGYIASNLGKYIQTSKGITNAK
jgi:hypothetical protein